MKLSFYGAAKEVTGSCYQLEVGDTKVLIDCGMQQGEDEKDNQFFPFNSGEIDAVLLTHAHIDHSGRLPLLVKNGFGGRIFTTRATLDLITIMLRDSAHIQMMDAQWDNKKGKRSGKDLAVPMYTIEDVEDTLRLVVPCEYKTVVKMDEGVSFMFTDAGHLLGSGSIHVWMTEKDTTKKIVFSGDIGNLNQPIIRDPQYIKEADYVVMESTYGDRDHEHTGDYVNDLAKLIDETLGKGGNVIIPSFAVGRTQELLYFIREMKEKKLVKSIPNFKVFVDSPLAGEATRIYDTDLQGFADDEAVELIKNGFHPTKFDGLRITQTTEESKGLNEDTEPKVIISASGMCDAGRIRHHLKHNLWRSECTVIFVGYQANGTLGRMILDGIKHVKLFGEEIVVAAKIVNFRGLSAHADKSGLLKWIGSYSPKPQKVFVIHGETTVVEAFSATLTELGHSVIAPNYRSKFDFIRNSLVDEGLRIEVVRKQEKVKPRKVSDAYVRLLESGDHLLKVIRENEGGANSDLAKFTSQILTLAMKWSKRKR